MILHLIRGRYILLYFDDSTEDDVHPPTIIATLTREWIGRIIPRWYNAANLNNAYKHIVNLTIIRILKVTDNDGKSSFNSG